MILAGCNSCFRCPTRPLAIVQQSRIPKGAARWRRRLPRRAAWVRGAACPEMLTDCHAGVPVRRDPAGPAFGRHPRRVDAGPGFPPGPSRLPDQLHRLRPGLPHGRPPAADPRRTPRHRRFRGQRPHPAWYRLPRPHPLPALGHVGLILLYDRQNQLVFGRILDAPTGTLTAVSPVLADRVAASPLLHRPGSADTPLSGLVVVSGETWLLSACPVLTSQRTGPPHGTLVLGRRLDAAKLETLSSAVMQH